MDLEALFEGVDIRDAHSADEHLELAVLDEYRRGLCSEADADAIQSHLVLCKECTALLLDMAAFPDIAGCEDEAITSERIDAEWVRLGSAVAKADAARSANVVELDSRRRRTTRVMWYAVAASLLAALLLGTVWMISQLPRKNEVATPSAPANQPANTGTESRNTSTEPTAITQPSLATRTPDSETKPARSRQNTQEDEPREIAMNTVRVELYPEEELRGSDDIKKTQLAEPSKTVSLVLHSAAVERFAAYSAEIRNQASAVVWSGSVSFRREGAYASARVPANVLADGVYSITLYGTSGTERKALDQYRLRIQR